MVFFVVDIESGEFEDILETDESGKREYEASHPEKYLVGEDDLLMDEDVVDLEDLW